MCYGAETIERKPAAKQVRVFQDGPFVVITRNGKAFYVNTDSWMTSDNDLAPKDFTTGLLARSYAELTPN